VDWDRISRIRDDQNAINNWRSSHNLPLFVIRRTLERRAKSISSEAVVAHRIKRLPSIEKKLLDNQYRHLKLTQIEDIGGCRAIMPNIDATLALADSYKRRSIGSELHRTRDYIQEPKDDGYRSIHLVYKYRSNVAQYQPFLGHRIEIQIRSQLQHAWATAVEVFITFTGIPAKIGPGEIAGILPRPVSEIANWRRFFALISSAMALKEGQPTVPGTPSDAGEVRNELRTLSVSLNAEELFLTWRNRVSDLLQYAVSGDVSQFLLRLNPSTGELLIRGFRKEEAEKAFEEYVTAEQPDRDAPTANVVLVSVDSIHSLQSAYPNYYADTQSFLEALHEAVS